MSVQRRAINPTKQLHSSLMSEVNEIQVSCRKMTHDKEVRDHFLLHCRFHLYTFNCFQVQASLIDSSLWNWVYWFAPRKFIKIPTGSRKKNSILRHSKFRISNPECLLRVKSDKTWYFQRNGEFFLKFDQIKIIDQKKNCPHSYFPSSPRFWDITIQKVEIVNISWFQDTYLVFIFPYRVFGRGADKNVLCFGTPRIHIHSNESGSQHFWTNLGFIGKQNSFFGLQFTSQFVCKSVPKQILVFIISPKQYDQETSNLVCRLLLGWNQYVKLLFRIRSLNKDFFISIVFNSINFILYVMKENVLELWAYNFFNFSNRFIR